MMSIQDDKTSIQHFTKAPILEAVGVTKVFKIGKQMVTPISDVSFQINYGDFVIIFGPSGAGKSTLLNILMGIEKPDIGEVILKEESFYNFSNEDRAKIRLKRFGLIPEQQIWIEQLTLHENIALPLIMQGTRKGIALKKAQKFIDTFGIDSIKKHRPTEASSGQNQKASIARALINDPWIVFADEPTGHLDTQSVEEVIKILVDINTKENKTIVMVTHDFEFLKFSKKWFFVKDGRLWNIKQQNSPLHSIKEVVSYIESPNKK